MALTVENLWQMFQDFLLIFLITMVLTFENWWQMFQDLETALQQYQDPAAADKITKIQKELEETKQVCGLEKP